MSWNSGPCVGGGDEEERNVTPPGDDEKVDPSRWHAVMAKSQTHWTELNYGHFDRSRGRVEDAG